MLNRLHSGTLSAVKVDEALTRFYRLGVEKEIHPEMVRRAREIARQYRQERIYDALYAALADLRACEFWTADRRFYEAVKKGLPYVNYLADYG
jgi:predicted nucleic acid-binding protein